MSRKVLGLEIREGSVAAALLSSGFKGSVLEAQGYFPIAADIPDDEALIAALQAAVESLKPTGAACVVGIPATFVSFRNLSLPFTDLRKIRQILPFELEPSLPTPVDELVFDFEAVKRDGQHDLLTFAVQKSVVRRYVDCLAAVNLRPAVIVPAGYAAARFISKTGPEGDDVLFIDTGDDVHTVYAVSGGSIRAVRSLPVANGGVPVRRHLETTIERTFTALAASSGITVNPRRVFSTGPQAAMLTGGTGSATLLGLPVSTIDEIRRFPRLKGALDSPELAGGQLDQALVLALMDAEGAGGVNFSTERSTFQHYWSEYRGSIVLTAVLVTLALATGLAGQLLAVNAKARRLAELDHRIETVFRQTFPDISQVVDPVRQMQVKINEMEAGSAGPELPQTQLRVIDILDALSRQIPASLDVNITRMVVGADNAVLSGDTDTFNTVDEVKAGLDGADIFNNVTISSADLEKTGERVRFKLKLEF
jgi:hypothetical protein